LTRFGITLNNSFSSNKKQVITSEHIFGVAEQLLQNAFHENCQTSLSKTSLSKYSIYKV